MSEAMRAILRLFFGNEVDRENFPRLRIFLCILLSLACFMVIIGILGNMIVASLPETSFDYKPFSQAANAFLLDLKAGKVTEAYARTSKEYQKGISEDQFKAIIQRNPFPTNGKGDSTLFSKSRPGKTIEYWFGENRASGSIAFAFEVTKQGDEYRVSKISLK